jgi:glycosyl transferase, family 25
MKTVEIVVISLPKATERRRRITGLFDGSGFNWRYFDAHTSLQHGGLSYDPSNCTRRFGRELSGPEVAICSSHVAVLDQYLKSGCADYVLVLEDDVIFDLDFPLGEFADFCATNDMDYVRLFCKQYAEAVLLGYFYDRHIVRFKTSPTGAQAYLMSKAGAEAFIDSFRSIDQPYDLALDSFWRSRLPIYSIFPFPFIERYSPSSNMIPPHPEGLGLSTEAFRFCHRVINKAKKTWANFALASADRRMQDKIGKFRQVLTVQPPAETSVAGTFDAAIEVHDAPQLIDVEPLKETK